MLLLDLINFKLFKCLINFWNCEKSFLLFNSFVPEEDPVEGWNMLYK